MTTDSRCVSRQSHQATATQLKERLVALEAAYVRENEAELAFYRSFLDANLFEVALHVLCDYLSEGVPRMLTPEIVGSIAELHRLMELEDDCVSTLNQKLKLWLA